MPPAAGRTAREESRRGSRNDRTVPANAAARGSILEAQDSVEAAQTASPAMSAPLYEP